MAVILQQLYDGIREKEKIDLVAGAGGMDHEVRWVHMVEDACISDFLEGEEIAFTTGVALASSEKLLELVQFNYQKKASGMVINIGPYIKEISQEIIDFANAHDFPIFAVPWKVHMANIMRYFSMEITLDEQKNLEFSSALKNALYFSDNEEMYVPTFLKYGYKKEWSYCIAVMELQDRTYNCAKERERKKMFRILQHSLRAYKEYIMLQEIDEEFVFFCNNYKEEKVQIVLQQIWEEVQIYVPAGHRMYAGVGRTMKNIHEVGKCYRQALQVKKMQWKIHNKNKFVMYSKLGVRKLLLAIDNEEIIQEYYEECLGALERYDHINETDYYYFLQQYFKLDCSAQQVARELHLHRNSVTYKLHKCEEIIGVDIASQENRTKLIVAFMLKEIQ